MGQNLLLSLPTQGISLEEFNALPDDPSIDSELVFGELVKRPSEYSDRWHAGVEAQLAAILSGWCHAQSPRPGTVFSGKVSCDLPSVDSSVVIDVAFFSKAILDAQDADAEFLVGAPVVAIEILSPSDVVANLNRKVKAYLEADVKAVWVVDPHDHKVLVFRPDAPPTILSEGDELSGEPTLPGLSFPISEVFN